MCVRNESWVLRFSLPAVLSWCDAVVVLLHACTDASANIVDEIASEHHGRVHVLEEPDPVWNEMNHRQRMLEVARERGAEVLALIDADEILAAPLRTAVRDAADRLLPRQTLVMPWLNLWRSLDVYRRDASLHGSGYQPMAFRDAFGMCWLPAHDGYQHHKRAPLGALEQCLLLDRPGLMHLQRACWRRAVARQAWYKVTEALRYPNRQRPHELDRQYSAALAEDYARLHPVPPDWWAYGLDRGLIDCRDWADWQELEVKRLLAQHGRERFGELDLFGLET
jgi:hypothetical protein